MKLRYTIITLPLLLIIVAGCAHEIPQDNSVQEPGAEEISIPKALDGIDKLGAPKNITQAVHQAPIKEILEQDPDYELLAELMKTNFNYSIENANYITAMNDESTQYMGISSGPLHKNEPGQFPVGIFVALYPVNNSKEVIQDGKKFYYIEEHTEKVSTAYYVDKGEIVNVIILDSADTSENTNPPIEETVGVK
jgi:hypothetical protein